MKKVNRQVWIMFLAILLFIHSQNVFSQTVVRISNGQNIQTIIDANSANSIFLLDPGTYAGFTVTKQATIIGSGYLNGLNSCSISSTINFNAGSSNSVITGCAGTSININTSNILIQKCKVGNSSNGIALNSSINSIIKQCYVEGSISMSSPINFQISNCFIGNSIPLTSIGSTTSGLIEGNTIGDGTSCSPLGSPSTTNGIIVRNNILLSQTTCTANNFSTTSFSSFNNNVLRQGNYATSNPTNTLLTNLTTLFVGTGNFEQSYQLSPTSPARSVGVGGIDCGMYGGIEPYLPSGTPKGPIIYDLIAPTTIRQNETIQVQIKAKIQN